MMISKNIDSLRFFAGDPQTLRTLDLWYSSKRCQASLADGRQQVVGVMRKSSTDE